MLLPRSEPTGALDCNGFPVAPGDLVVVTNKLDPKIAGKQGVVADICRYGILHVQMADKVLPESNAPEVLVAASWFWKLVAHGAS